MRWYRAMLILSIAVAALSAFGGYAAAETVDAEKAYLYRQSATQTATHFETVFSEDGIVTYYTRTLPPEAPDGIVIDGVTDSGTDCLFVGLAPGRVDVTIYKVLDFLNGERDVWDAFTLLVDEELNVTRVEE